MRVLNETDHKETASLIGSYARLITKQVYSFRFITNYWCCVGANHNLWECQKGVQGEANQFRCPASSYCFFQPFYKHNPQYPDKGQLAKHVVITEVKKRDKIFVGTYLPDLKNALRVEKNIKKIVLKSLVSI
jgi:hypothetical protein